MSTQTFSATGSLVLHHAATGLDEKLPHLLGDDSLNSLRTKRTNFIPLLKQAGYEEWTQEEKLWEVRAVLAAILGAERVLVSREGFNAVGGLGRTRRILFSPA